MNDERDKLEWRPAKPTWSPQSVAGALLPLATGAVILGFIAISGLMCITQAYQG